jgi:glycyl-tRNA synthetase beta subunit
VSHELLLEIGTEEIPARFLPDAEVNLRDALAARFHAWTFPLKTSPCSRRPAG